MYNNEYRGFSKVQMMLFIILAFLLIPVTCYNSSFNIIAVNILPVVVAVVYLRFDLIKTSLILIGSAIITAFLINKVLAIQGLVLFGAIGLVLGKSMKDKKSPLKTFTTLIITTLVTFVVIIFIQMIATNSSFSSLIQGYVDATMKKLSEVKEAYVSLGVSEKELQFFDLASKLITVKNIIYVLPSTMLSMAIGASFINYILGRKLGMKATSIEIQPLIVGKIYVTNLLGAFFIGITCIGIILSPKYSNIGEFLKYFGFGVTRSLLLLNGIAAFTYLLRNKLKKSKVFTFWMVFIGLLVGLGQIYLFIGFFEMIFDFRRLDPFSLSKGKKSK